MAKVAVIGCTHAGVFATRSILQAHPDWQVHVFERNDTVSFLSCGIALWIGDHVSLSLIHISEPTRQYS